MPGLDENKFTFDFLDSLDDFRKILAELLQIILDSPSTMLEFNIKVNNTD